MAQTSGFFFIISAILMNIYLVVVTMRMKHACNYSSRVGVMRVCVCVCGCVPLLISIIFSRLIRHSCE